MSRKALLAAFIEEVWSRGDVSRLERYLADSYLIEHDPGDPWEGQRLSREDFRGRVLTSRAAAPDQRFTLVQMVEEAGTIAAAWTWAGTHLGDLPGLPASGKAITMSGLTLYRFQGALICGHWQIADRLSVFRQLSGPG